ncbi:hypothetical protein BH10PAT3_BH10PAT3_5160 [soil metagenome]
MNFLNHQKHETTSIPVSVTEKTADKLSDEAWSDPAKVIMAGDSESMPVSKAIRIAKDVSASLGEPHDRGINSINDIFPEAEVDSINKATAEAISNAATIPNMSLVHELGKHIVVNAVESTPARIDVHTGARQDVA